nr:capsid protein [Mute swan feces associated circular virus 11]
MTTPQVAAWLAGLALRGGSQAARTAGSRLSRRLFKNRAALLGAAAGVGGANLAVSHKRTSDQGLKNYYRVTKRPGLPEKKRVPRKALNPKRGAPTQMPGKRKVAHRGPYAGRFKRPRVVRGKPMYGNKHIAYGTVTSQNAVYHGYQACGSRDILIREFSEQLLRSILRESKVAIKTRDTAIPWAGPTRDESFRDPFRIAFYFHLVQDDGSIVVSTVDTNLDTSGAGSNYKSFDDVATGMATSFAAEMSVPNKYLYSYTIFKGDGSGIDEGMTTRNVAEWSFNVNVSTNYKVQNITPADLGTGNETFNRDNIASNPLQGRVWEFSGAAPRFRGQFSNMIGSANSIEKSDHPYGLIVFPAANDNVYDVGNYFHSVPTGTVLFQNCSKTGTVNLTPGGHKNIVKRYNFSGTVRHFCKRIAASDDHKFGMGDAICVGLQPSMRTTNDEAVTIAFHLDIGVKARLSPRYKIHLNQNNASQQYTFT